MVISRWSMRSLKGQFTTSITGAAAAVVDSTSAKDSRSVSLRSARSAMITTHGSTGIANASKLMTARYMSWRNHPYNTQKLTHGNTRNKTDGTAQERAANHQSTDRTQCQTRR